MTEVNLKNTDCVLKKNTSAKEYIVFFYKNFCKILFGGNFKNLIIFTLLDSTIAIVYYGITYNTSLIPIESMELSTITQCVIEVLVNSLTV